MPVIATRQAAAGSPASAAAFKRSRTVAAGVPAGNACDDTAPDAGGAAVAVPDGVAVVPPGPAAAAASGGVAG